MLDNMNIIDSVTFNSIKSKEKSVTDTVSNAASFNETLRKELAPSRNKQEDKRLMEVCVEMESIFVAKMLKEMRKTVHKTGWINGGFAEEIFEDMLYDKYAMSVSKNSNLGLASMLYDEMSRK